MSKAPLLSLLLVLVALAGCSNDPAPPQPEEADDGTPRRSVGGPGGNNTDAPHVKITLLEAGIRLVGPSQQTFEVEVPVNITNVDATIASPGSAYQEDALTFALDGCGSTSAGGISGQYGGPVTRTYRVCTDPATGMHTLTVSGGPASLIDGTLRLVGQQPLGNETAAP